MIDAERRQQVLQAEAAIRQLSEKLAEHISARQAAEEAAARFLQGSETFSGAHATLQSSAAILAGAQKSLTGAQEELRAVARFFSEQAEKIGNGGIALLAGLRTEREKLESAATSLVSAGEIARRALEGQALAVEAYGRQQAEAIEAAHQLLAARLSADTETLKQTFAQYCATVVERVEAQSRIVQSVCIADNDTAEARQQALHKRLNIMAAVCGILLLAILGILIYRW